MKSILFFALIPVVLLSDANGTIEEFEKIEVEGSAYIQKQDFLEDAPMQKQITTIEALDIPGSNGDPLKAIKTFAGVVSTDNDMGEMIIHGSKPRETTYTINHLPLGYVFHLGGLHSVIAPEATKQIDAYLGAFDVSYYGMGAAIDITPQYPVGKNGGRVHIGMYDSDFAFDGKITDNISMFVSGRRSYFDLIAARVMDELYVDSDDSNKTLDFTLFPQFYDANFMLNANYGNHMLSLEAITAQDELKLYSTLGGDSDPAANGKIESKLGFTTVGTRWIYYGDDFTSNTLAYQLKTNFELELFADNFVDAITTTRGINHYTDFEFENHKPKIGFEYININSPIVANSIAQPYADDPQGSVTGSEVVSINKTFIADVYTLFAQNIYSVSDDFRVRYGIRASKIDYANFSHYIDPRGSVIYDITDNSVISFSAGQYSQLPKDDVSIEGFGNPEIDTLENSKHYAFSIKHNFDSDSYLQIEPYYKSFQNLAIRDETYKYLSVGKGYARGVDVTYKKDVDNFKMIFAYTYLDSKRDLDTNSTKMYDFYGEIPHTLQISTSYKFKSGWKVASLFKYSSGKLYTPINGSTTKYTDNNVSYEEPNSGEPFSERLPDLYDLDIKISKTYKSKSGSSHEHSIELMNISSLFRENIADIKYDDYYNQTGYFYQMGFIPAYHYTYRF